MIRSLILLIFVLSSTAMTAQSTDNSIFSRFGLGDIITPSYASFQGMGGAASGYFTPYTINSVNPASYASLNTTVFDVGLSARYFRTDFRDTEGSNTWVGHLENVAIAFPLRNSINKSLDPLKKNWDYGMALGLNPISRVGYSVSSTESLDNIGKVQKDYEGYGGLYKFYWGNSFKYKDFSVGVNASYLFGRLSYEKNILFADIQGAFDDYFTTSYNARGFQLDYGLAYTYNFRKDDEKDANNLVGNILTLGLHGTLPTSLKTLSDQSNVLIQDFGTGTLISSDTLLFQQEVEGALNLPSAIGFGISYQQEMSWAISASYTLTPWSNYENDANPESLNNVSGIQIGGWYTPDYKSYTSYFKRIKYKLGGFYRTEPVSIGDNGTNDDVKHYGITLGTQLPFVNQRKISRADIALILGYKGNEVLNERYLNIRFGFSFNDDQWFLKRKYN